MVFVASHRDAQDDFYKVQLSKSFLNVIDRECVNVKKKNVKKYVIV